MKGIKQNYRSDLRLYGNYNKLKENEANENSGTIIDRILTKLNKSK